MVNWTPVGVFDLIPSGDGVALPIFRKVIGQSSRSNELFIQRISGDGRVSDFISAPEGYSLKELPEKALKQEQKAIGDLALWVLKLDGDYIPGTRGEIRQRLSELNWEASSRIGIYLRLEIARLLGDDIAVKEATVAVSELISNEGEKASAAWRESQLLHDYRNALVNELNLSNAGAVSNELISTIGAHLNGSEVILSISDRLLEKLRPEQIRKINSAALKTSSFAALQVRGVTVEGTLEGQRTEARPARVNVFLSTKSYSRSAATASLSGRFFGLFGSIGELDGILDNPDVRDARLLHFIVTEPGSQLASENLLVGLKKIRSRYPGALITLVVVGAQFPRQSNFSVLSRGVGEFGETVNRILFVSGHHWERDRTSIRLQRSKTLQSILKRLYIAILAFGLDRRQFSFEFVDGAPFTDFGWELPSDGTISRKITIVSTSRLDSDRSEPAALESALWRCHSELGGLSNASRLFVAGVGIPAVRSLIGRTLHSMEASTAISEGSKDVVVEGMQIRGRQKLKYAVCFADVVVSEAIESSVYSYMALINAIMIDRGWNTNFKEINRKPSSLLVEIIGSSGGHTIYVVPWLVGAESSGNALEFLVSLRRVKSQPGLFGLIPENEILLIVNRSSPSMSAKLKSVEGVRMLHYSEIPYDYEVEQQKVAPPPQAFKIF